MIQETTAGTSDTSTVAKGYQPTSGEEEDTDTRIEVNQKEFFEIPNEEKDNSEQPVALEESDGINEEKFEKVEIMKKNDKKLAKSKKLKEKRDKTEMKYI